MTATDRLAEIKARAENTTSPGPWDYRPSQPGLGSVYYRDPGLSKDYPVPGCGHCGLNDSVYETGDGEFIAHARTDVPALLAALDAVLAEHECITERVATFSGSEVISWCRICAPRIEDRWENRYPCPTVQAITEALEVDQ